MDFLLPVIFLTERGSTEERIRGYQVGCDIYLPKPFEMEELKAVIRNLLERSQMVQSERQYQKLKPKIIIFESMSDQQLMINHLL